MLMRILVLLAAFSLLGAGAASAGSHDRSHHWRRRPAPVAVAEPPRPYDGPTLVMHPANNIACDTPYRATRALPCDQPVWVYGHPCEIDLGLGRKRSCD
jgi:hypothetical protein